MKYLDAIDNNANIYKINNYSNKSILAFIFIPHSSSKTQENLSLKFNFELQLNPMVFHLTDQALNIEKSIYTETIRLYRKLVLKYEKIKLLIHIKHNANGFVWSNRSILNQNDDFLHKLEFMKDILTIPKVKNTNETELDAIELNKTIEFEKKVSTKLKKLTKPNSKRPTKRSQRNPKKPKPTQNHSSASIGDLLIDCIDQSTDDQGQIPKITPVDLSDQITNDVVENTAVHDSINFNLIDTSILNPSELFKITINTNTFNYFNSLTASLQDILNNNEITSDLCF